MPTPTVVVLDVVLLGLVVVAHLREQHTVPRTELVEAALTWPALAVMGAVKTLISPPGNHAVAVGVGAMYAAALVCTLGHPYRISEPYLKASRPLSWVVRVQLALFTAVTVAVLLWIVSVGE